MNSGEATALLDRGETLVWSARPTPLGYALKKCGLQWFFGLFFFAFSLFWINGAMAASQRGGSFFWMLGIPFVLIGVGLVLSPAWFYLQAGRTLYALTNRRIIIDTTGSWGKRVSIPLGSVPFVELQRGIGGTGHVLFRQEIASGRNFGVKRDGFLAIADAAGVERNMRDAIEKYARPATP
jgi:hypothetical protein